MPNCVVKGSKNQLSKNKKQDGITFHANTSWSRGWLRCLVQAFFCIITVISFILIVYMAFGSSKPSSATRCQTLGCSILCKNTPYFDKYEEHIDLAVTELAVVCDHVFLSLRHPAFPNNTLPEQWLSSLPSAVYELEIIGGNLQYIAPQAFMSRFTRYIRRLSFEFITLMEWKQHTLLGLMELQELVFKSCNFVTIEKNALEPVDDTLRTLSVTGSGYWDPANLTGSSQFKGLTDVIFSSNNFNNILRRGSFAQMTCCTVLFLNSCRIHAIGPGTFDSLVSIQVLHLNNNFLQVLPTGLFDHVIPVKNPRPRINLQDNRWLCDCTNSELRRLSTAGLLLVDPFCYYPVTVRGQTFEQHLESCNNRGRDDFSRNVSTHSSISSDNSYSVYMDTNCQNKSTRFSLQLTLLSPLSFLRCGLNRSRIREDLMSLVRRPQFNRPQSNEILQTSFAMGGPDFSLLELSSRGSNKHGLIWYQDECKNEIYCVSSIPNYLRVYNVNKSAEYTFCPWAVESGRLVYSKCVFYNLVEDKTRRVRAIIYTMTVLLCFSGGALIIYLIIRKFPGLLKGSNRILFVKHRDVDALILPPKVPLRSSLVDSEPIAEFNNKRIFMLPNSGMVNKTPFVRMTSVRSCKSSAPSYISALQPTDEQLTEWRLRLHFDNNMTLLSDSKLESLPVYEDDEISYCSLSAIKT